MHGDRRGDDVLNWVALVIPGMTVGLGFAATEGWPVWNRVLAGVAAGLVVYAALHFAIKGVKGNRR